mgnify:CR=1 FL=1
MLARSSTVVGMLYQTTKSRTLVAGEALSLHKPFPEHPNAKIIKITTTAEFTEFLKVNKQVDLVLRKSTVVNMKMSGEKKIVDIRVIPDLDV